MKGIDPAWVSAALALIALIAGFTIWVFRMAWKLISRTMRFLDDYFGEEARPGVPARPGVMERIDKVETSLQEIHSEVKPNGGSSMRDVVQQTADDVASLRTQVERIDARTKRQNGTVHG